jgi:hypothetical protein
MFFIRSEIFSLGNAKNERESIRMLDVQQLISLAHSLAR